MGSVEDEFYDERKADAMSGLATGKKTVREQEILTPACITDIARAVFGGQIQLDPCAAINRETLQVLGTTNPVSTFSGYCPEDDGKMYREDDGLSQSWVDDTFVNPPYRDLKAWLAKSLVEKSKEQILLFPVRPNRVWWCDYMREVDVYAFLKPLRFVGYNQAFPAPLCLAYFGPRKREFELECFMSRTVTHVRTGGI